MKHGLIPTPPRLLYSQLAYRDETVCVGGGTDEVGGPCVCVIASVSVCEVGFALRVLRGRDGGRLVQSSVKSRRRTARYHPN